MRRYKLDRVQEWADPYQIVRAIRDAECEVNADRRRGVLNAALMRERFRPRIWESDLVGDSGTDWLEARPTPTLRTWEEGIAVMGVAWWTAPDGSVHVRIVGEVIVGENAPDTNRQLAPWGITSNALFHAHPASVVYPALWCATFHKRPDSHVRDVRRELRLDPFDVYNWSLLADWYEDHGNEEEGRKAREALAQLDRIAPCLVSVE